MKKTLIVFIASIFLNCVIKPQSNNDNKNFITVSNSNLLGSWSVSESSSEWKIFYPKLVFINDSMIMIQTRGDTIVNCCYVLNNDSLYLRNEKQELLGGSKILELTTLKLILSNILLENNSVTYYKQ